MSQSKQFEEFMCNLNSLILENSLSKSEDFIKYMNLVVDDNTINVEKGAIYYRARIYNKDDRFEKWHNRKEDNKNSYGYTADESYINLHSTPEANRCNKDDERVAYMATDPITAIHEVCSKPGVSVSVAKIEISEPLRIINFADSVAVSSGSTDTDYDIELLNAFKFELIQSFNKSALSKADYIFTQNICNYLKSIGIDGVQYASSYNMMGSTQFINNLQNNIGINLALFNHSKGQIMSKENTKLYLITESSISIEPFTC